MNKDRIGRCGGLLAGVIVCSLVLAVVGCEPQSPTMRIRARDLSVAMVGHVDDFLLQDPETAEEEWVTASQADTDPVRMASGAWRRRQKQEKADKELDFRLRYLRLYGAPIHGRNPRSDAAARWAWMPGSRGHRGHSNW